MNLVVLEGRLTTDPEIRYTTGENATATARFSVAVNRDFKNSQGQYDADFIRCIAWRNQAEFVGKYFHKGDPILITGNIRTGSYTNKDGMKVYTTDVWADKVNFVVGGKASNAVENTQAAPKQDNSFMNIPGSIGDDGILPF